MNNEIREEKIRQNRLCRSKQLRLHMIMLISAVALVCVILVIVLCISVNAAEDDTNAKCYKSIMVNYGESLTALSESNVDTDHYSSVTDYSDEIISINHLKNESVRPGQYIIIPYYKEIR